jgi:hypothetical protein
VGLDIVCCAVEVCVLVHYLAIFSVSKLVYLSMATCATNVRNTSCF